MERLSTVWAELQKANKLPSSLLVSSCQSELQDLMYQLDVMFSSKKQQWMQEMEDLQAQLHSKDKELRSQRTVSEIKTRETEDLRNQLEGVNKTQKAMVSEYEEHLAKLRGEVLKVRKEYEKLHKQHQRYRKDLQRKKDQAETEKKESLEELSSIKERLKEYQVKEHEWEIKCKNHQQENEVLEAQNRTLLEKYELIKQQAQVYQTQIGRRREIQHSSEDNLKSHIVKLESQVECATEAITSQNEKIEKLRHALETAMDGHKQAMVENEKLLDDLQKANETIQMQEERIAQVERECRTLSDLLHAAQDEIRLYSADLVRMEKTVDAKDCIINQQSNRLEHDESEKLMLKDCLQTAQDDLSISRKTIMKMEQKLLASSNQLDFLKQEQETIRQSLKEKEKELNHNHNAEVHQLRKETASMQQMLTELTKELNQRNKTIALMSEKCSELERTKQEEAAIWEKKAAELKVSQLQIEAVRAENHRLRQGQLRLPPATGNTDQHHTLADLQEQNNNMRQEINILRNSFEDLVQQQRRLSSGTPSFRSVGSDKHFAATGHCNLTLEEHSLRGNFSDGSGKQYEDQLQLLPARKARQEMQMGQSSHTGLRIAAEKKHLKEGSRYKAAYSHLDDSQGTVLESEPMSMVSEQHNLRIERLQLSTSSSEDEFVDVTEEVAKAFYDQETQRAHELEKRLDTYIRHMSTGFEFDE